MSSWRPALGKVPKLGILNETNETTAWAKGMPR